MHALPRRELVTKNAEHYLRNQLLAQADFAGTIEPEPHAFFFQLASCSVVDAGNAAGLGRR